MLSIIGFTLILIILVICCVKSQRRARINAANRNANEVIEGEVSPEEDQRLIEQDKPPLINTVDQGIPGDILLPSAEELHNNVDDDNDNNELYGSRVLKESHIEQEAQEV